MNLCTNSFRIKFFKIKLQKKFSVFEQGTDNISRPSLWVQELRCREGVYVCYLPVFWNSYNITLPSRSVGKVHILEFFYKRKYARISIILAINVSKNIFTFGGRNVCHLGQILFIFKIRSRTAWSSFPLMRNPGSTTNTTF